MYVSKKQYHEHMVSMGWEERALHDRSHCDVCIGRRHTKERQATARETRSMIADMCGTSYAAAKRDMGI
jgi:hypothetical protein